MPPKNQRTWSDDEIGFAIRDWLFTFGRLPRPDDWRPNTLPGSLHRYGAVRADGRARWPSAKSVRRRFGSWDRACSHALVGAVWLAPNGDSAVSQVNLDDAVKAILEQRIALRTAALFDEAANEGQSLGELAAHYPHNGMDLWNAPQDRPDVPPPLEGHPPSLF